MDCTYNYYLDGQRVIEEHDGSDNLLKQHVWGLGYVDEAVQVAINSDPTNSSHQTCDQAYWLCEDANYNVLGIVDSTGTLRERYEYSAYGQRQVFTSAGSNDPGCYSPTTMSTRVVTSGSVVEPYGINDLGHQGLMHDEEDGLVYNRARMLNPTLGRFMQEDPKGYVDGLSLYQYERGNPVKNRDDSGTVVPGGTGTNPNRHACCHGTNYDPISQCCDGSTVVAKVSIWICTRRFAHYPGIPVIPLGNHSTGHGYFCCGGANVDCYGNPGTYPPGLPAGYPPAGATIRTGDPLPPETLIGGDCQEFKICPRAKCQKCNNPTAKQPLDPFYLPWGWTCQDESCRGAWAPF